METYIVKVPVTGKVEIVPFNVADSYSQLRDAVGGFIEAATIPAIPTKENYTIDCFVKQLPLNKRLTAFARPVYNPPLVGNAVFVAHNDQWDTVGLTKADAESIVKTINNVGV